MNLKFPIWILPTLLLTIAFGVDAQQPGKTFRIGFLDNSTAASMASLVTIFRQEMHKLGWIEGKTFTIDSRYADQNNQRLTELAVDLARLNVDLIVTTGGTAALAAKKATGTIPVVVTNSGDPVGEGLVASLARPGGNVTGLSSLAVELNTKRLEILKDAVPNLHRVGLLWTMGGVIVTNPNESAQSCGDGAQAQLGRNRDATGQRGAWRAPFKSPKENR